jgi:hypothetical protein
MSMTIAAGMIALGESFRDMATGAHVLDALDRDNSRYSAARIFSPQACRCRAVRSIS